MNSETLGVFDTVTEKTDPVGGGQMSVSVQGQSIKAKDGKWNLILNSHALKWRLGFNCTTVFTRNCKKKNVICAFLKITKWILRQNRMTEPVGNGFITHSHNLEILKSHGLIWHLDFLTERIMNRLFKLYKWANVQWQNLLNHLPKRYEITQLFCKYGQCSILTFCCKRKWHKK